jgi:hypothetical protein
MKISELNAKNLHSIGFTIDLLKNENEFNDWLIKNDVRINFVTNEIYTEVNTLKDFVSNELLLLKKDMDSDLYDFDKKSLEYKTEIKEKLFNNDLDESSQFEFICKVISKGLKKTIDIRENKINDLVNGMFETIESEPEKIVINDTSIKEKYLGQPTNDNANDFFDFLIEYYRPEDNTQVKYVNILHYLKNDADKNHFIFKVKQDKFRTLVKAKTGIEISKFEKSAKYLEEEKPIFHTLENTFFKKMKV